MSIQPTGQQLQMIMSDVEVSVPPPPDGYVLRTFRSTDAAKYLDLMHAAGFTSWGPETLAGTLNHVLPDGLFVIEHESGELVATAMATHSPAPLHPFGGELGWVAGHPEHRGKGLGAIVCAAVVDRFRRAGYRRIYLRTDDHRLPAIKVYLKLGFVPFLFAPDMQERWQAVCAKLNWPFTPEKWPSVESQAPAPVEDGERPNADRADRYRPRRKWLPGRPHKAYPGGLDFDAFGDESIYKPSLLGSVRARPTHVPAGARSSLEIVYTAGPAGVAKGTTVSIGTRGQAPLGQMPECVLTAPDGCIIEKRDRGFTVLDGCISEGQEVRLAWEPFDWTPLAGKRELKVVFTYPDNRPEQRLSAPLVLNVLPLEVDRLELTLPCTHAPGQSVDGRITTRDQFDNRVPICDSVVLSSGQELPLVSGGADFQVKDPDKKVIRVTARNKSLQQDFASNPSVPSEDYQLYVGDLHAHDFLSEAEGYPDAVYRWAIEDRRLDFVSVVPQCHGWLDNETWTITKYMNERYLDEGKFVTFLGFEWQHTGYGDKVIHYLGGDHPYLPADDPRYSSPAKIYRVLKDTDAFVISHHTAYPENSWCPATDFDVIDTDLERVMEIWSMHGSSEGYDDSDRPLWRHNSNCTAMAALRKGLRLGFVAGSDTHSARPGGSAKEPMRYWGGLAAVWAKDLTRQSIYDAIRARRTYALTRARIVLRMTVNNAWMGSELPASDLAQIRIEVWAQAPIAKVQVMKNTHVLREFGPFGDECKIELEDVTGGPAFYHCRVIQTDGELAVCSPVWVG